MAKLPIILRAATKRKVNQLFNTSEIAIRKLEKAKNQGLIPKEKVDAWIKEIKEGMVDAEKDIEKKKNELEQTN